MSNSEKNQEIAASKAGMDAKTARKYLAANRLPSEIAKERQITQIVLGQPARRRWEEMLRGSTVNRILRMGTKIDIHLVPLDEEE